MNAIVSQEIRKACGLAYSERNAVEQIYAQDLSLKVGKEADLNLKALEKYGPIQKISQEKLFGC